MRPLLTLNKLVVVALLGGFAMLLIEIRYAHRDVLGMHRIAWTPIAYSGLMLPLGVAGLIGWGRGGRRALFWAFAAGLLVGPAGAWFHNHGRPLRGLGRELSAWTAPSRPANDAGAGAGAGDEGGPPALAPLAFAGLGLLGMLACAGRFQPEAADRASRGDSGSA